MSSELSPELVNRLAVEANIAKVVAETLNRVTPGKYTAVLLPRTSYVKGPDVQVFIKRSLSSLRVGERYLQLEFDSHCPVGRFNDKPRLFKLQAGLRFNAQGVCNAVEEWQKALDVVKAKELQEAEEAEAVRVAREANKVNAAEIRDRLETETRERLKGRFMVGPALPPSSEYSNCLRIQVSPLSSNRVYVLAVDEHQTTLEIRLSAPNSNQLALLDLIPQLDKLA